ncbi:uncharacterized protein LOC34620163 [Cyclospora cayetanensis]|uniref:Uncharacterized protein n=2 Tax=Cyclospora cayetanensis TaxID=88456 RepID=A0A1D3DB08_9EIME|nr:uncharacterized protein LOC34620163 [Cyclospora cayetanensis]OEH80644.1 hypothetical protein cyc_03480 [Cyclospora cayetanensis]
MELAYKACGEDLAAVSEWGEDMCGAPAVSVNTERPPKHQFCNSAEIGAQNSALENKQSHVRPMSASYSAPGFVRSYSIADPSNEAFTVSHELDFDDWMTTIIGTLQLVVSSAVIFLGIYLLVTCPEMAEEAPLLFYFVAFSLSAELALLMLICLLMMALRLLCGPARSAYSSAICGIFHRTMEGMIYFLCVGFGGTLLVLLATGDPTDPRVRYLGKRQEFVWAFVTMEVALCLLYCLQTIPTLYGVCKFASHKIFLKVTGRDELEFQRGDVPVAYARLSDYDYSLQHMNNPAAVTPPEVFIQPNGRWRDAQFREEAHTQRTDAERALLGSDV